MSVNTSISLYGQCGGGRNLLLEAPPPTIVPLDGLKHNTSTPFSNTAVLAHLTQLGLHYPWFP